MGKKPRIVLIFLVLVLLVVGFLAWYDMTFFVPGPDGRKISRPL